MKRKKRIKKESRRKSSLLFANRIGEKKKGCPGFKNGLRFCTKGRGWETKKKRHSFVCVRVCACINNTLVPSFPPTHICLQRRFQTSTTRRPKARKAGFAINSCRVSRRDRTCKRQAAEKRWSGKHSNASLPWPYQLSGHWAHAANHRKVLFLFFAISLSPSSGLREKKNMWKRNSEKGSTLSRK